MSAAILQTRDLSQALARLHAEVSAGITAAPELYEAFWHMLSHARCEVLPETEQRAVEATTRAIGAHWRSWLSAQEDRVSRFLAAGDRHGGTLASVLSIEGYSGILEESHALASVQPTALAFVGCGPYPETLAGLAGSCATLRHIVGIDRSECATRAARDVFPNLCSREVHSTFQACDATAFDFAGWPAVFIANGTVGKAAVMARIAATAPPGCHVLVRQPAGLAVQIYERVEDCAPFEEICRVATTRLSELSFRRLSPVRL